MYGAKGGEVYVLGNAAGRPLINAAGCPRVVINSTCLDYLAESFMAGDPLEGGGFVVLNGGRFMPFTAEDWALILPYLEENERQFGIRVEALLTVVGEVRRPEEVYRKVGAVQLTALS